MSTSLDRPHSTALGQLSTEAPPEDVPMTVLEHIGELRSRLIKALLGLIPGTWIGWAYKEYLLEYLLQPLSIAWKQLHLPGEPQIHFSNPVDQFVAYMKIAIVCGLLISSPWVFWQLWAFVAPGLYKKERNYAIPFVLASTVFFAGGAFFGYKVVFPLGFETLLGFEPLPSGTISVMPTIMLTEYMDFVTRMLLAFGVVFEVPVIVTFLAMVGIVNWKQLMKFGRWWVVIASIIAAVLTPPDVGSQMLMLVPLVVLYFMSVGLAYLFGPKVEPEAKADGEAGGS